MTRTRKSLLTLLALAALTEPARVILAALLPDAAADPVPGMLAGMALSLVMLGLPAWLLRPWTGTRLTRRGPLWSGVLLGAATAVLIRAAMGPLDLRWQELTGVMPRALPAPDGFSLGALCVVALAVVPALTEEAFFRGALLTGLLEGSRRVAAVHLTTVCFVLMHGNLASLPSLMVLAILLALLMIRTGHIAVPVAAHLVYNLTALKWTALPGWVGILSGAVLAGMVVYLANCHLPDGHRRMKTTDTLMAAAAIAVMVLYYFV